VATPVTPPPIVSIGHCPRCNAPLSAPAALAGRTVDCPDCGTAVVATPVAAPAFDTMNLSAAPPVIRRKPWAKRAALNLLLLAVFVGVCWFAVRAAFPPPGVSAESRSHTRTPAEELVKRFVLNNAEEPGRVRFVKWGPHMSKRELEELVQEAGLDEVLRVEAVQAELKRYGKFGEMPDWVIRVFYREPVTAYGPDGKRKAGAELADVDRLFLVYGKIVIPIADSRPTWGALGGAKIGDDWKKNLRKELAKVFPGIDPGR
jgi:hypothetical protein